MSYLLQLELLGLLLLMPDGILANRSACVMCISVSFSQQATSGHIEYTNIHNGTHYTRSLEPGVRSYNYLPIHIHDGTINVINAGCITDTYNDNSNDSNSTLPYIYQTTVPSPCVPLPAVASLKQNTN